MRVRLLYPATGKGLERDAALVSSLLSGAGFLVEVQAFPERPVWVTKVTDVFERNISRVPRWLSALLVRMRLGLGWSRPKADVNLFLQTLRPSWISAARHNLLMPNQEWFRPALIPWLDWVDCVMCKTQEAERVFSALGCRTEFTSFTSDDKCQVGVEKDYNLALHFAGAGLSKGTKPVLEAWGRHPEWPLLHVTQRNNFSDNAAANIRIMAGYLAENDLALLQAKAGYYVGPSQSEGFGHALVEAMSAGCVVITTDAPPMNELIDDVRGFLVPVSMSRPLRLGVEYSCTSEAVELILAKAFALDSEKKKKMGQAARAWYLRNDAFFRSRFLDVFSRLSGPDKY